MAATYSEVIGPNGQVEQGMILRSDGVFIPFDPANRDYQAYLAWIAAGNEPSGPGPAPAIPTEPAPTTPASPPPAIPIEIPPAPIITGPAAPDPSAPFRLPEP